MDRDEVFKEALRENDKMIIRLCNHFFGPGENAKDAHQEILLKIWLNIGKFRNESQLKTWIYRIAVNVCLTFLSSAKRKSSLFVRLSKSAYNTSYEDESFYSDDENKIQFLRNFLDNLNPTDKVLVSLYLEDFDTKEMSNITGLSESNVRVKIHRIKNEIRKEWQDKYGT
ncbi:MAG: sigma-70 family RNA polymerase sigma factor [Ignavibacterium sp.]|jgi:RNA polymerase sigma-70 factor (ECF subfamily)|nr:sigma-70 family RNA polymerase sigma factor [Ignavibacterium sp.]